MFFRCESPLCNLNANSQNQSDKSLNHVTVTSSQTDIDCDGTEDNLVVQEIDGSLLWKIQFISKNEFFEGIFGDSEDQIFISDTNGDCNVEMVVVNKDFNWHLKSPFHNQIVQTQWGQTGDIPLPPIDLDDDNKADFMVIRPSRNLNNQRSLHTKYGNGLTNVQNIEDETDI